MNDEFFIVGDVRVCVKQATRYPAGSTSGNLSKKKPVARKDSGSGSASSGIGFFNEKRCLAQLGVTPLTFYRQGSDTSATAYELGSCGSDFDDIAKEYSKLSPWEKGWESNSAKSEPNEKSAKKVKPRPPRDFSSSDDDGSYQFHKEVSPPSSLDEYFCKKPANPNNKKNKIKVKSEQKLAKTKSQRLQKWLTETVPGESQPSLHPGSSSEKQTPSTSTPTKKSQLNYFA